MKTCNEDHYEVSYSDEIEKCPVCEVIDERDNLHFEINEMEDHIDELENVIKALEEELKEERRSA